MKLPLRAFVIVVAVSVIATWSGLAFAQGSKDHPTSNDVSQQFKSGADRVGDGAAQIGEGIKQGAILTWEAIKSGFNSATATFDDDRTSSSSNKRRSSSNPGADASRQTR